MNNKRCVMLACNNLKNEIMNLLAQSNAQFPVIFMPAELHIAPEKLRTYLQSMLDSITNVEYILLPMGRCGNATVGLVSKNASLVLPRCNDCIDLLLSGDSIKTERPRYSYFITAGWLGNPASIDIEYKHITSKYGKRAQGIINAIYKNYKYFTLLDTKSYDIEKTKAAITPLARAAKMEINLTDAPCGALRKMLALNFDADFAVIPAGEAVNEADFTMAGAVRP